MKKIISCMLAVSLLLSCSIFASVFADAEEAEISNQSGSVIDFEAIYALYEPDEIIGTVDGRDVTWGEYFYYFYSYAQTFAEMQQYYGGEPKWTDIIDEENGLTLAEIPAVYAGEQIRQYATLPGFAKANGIELSEAYKTLVDIRIAEDIANYCGEGATEEDFAAVIAESYLPLEVYKTLMQDTYLYAQVNDVLFGTSGSKIDDDLIIEYLEENDYISANHILFLTLDRATGEMADEDTARAKKQQAEEIIEELRAIDDTAQRLEKFAELKETYCEDTGKAYYHDGYTFTPGTMVSEFENACRALNDYEISDVVESVYGYHVLLKLPLNPDALIEYSSEGEAVTARAKVAAEISNAAMQEYFESIELEFKDSFEKPNLMQYIG